MLREIDSRVWIEGAHIVADAAGVETQYDAEALAGMTDEELAAIGLERFEPPVPAAPVPAKIALWQARAILTQTPSGTPGQTLLDAANALVAASGDPVLETFWEYGVDVSRASPTLAALAAQLGLTGAQLDQLFRDAAVLAP